jgi:acetoin:2,6-dichlorophenolindophenol oxidoreductase subunit alpha
VADAVRAAVLRARSGEGPSMVECLTYRVGGHKRDDAAPYRSRAEVEAWLARDPIPRCADVLRARGLIDAHGLDAIQREVSAELDTAADAALASPPADPATVLDDVYA